MEHDGDAFGKRKERGVESFRTVIYEMEVCYSLSSWANGFTVSGTEERLSDKSAHWVDQFSEWINDKDNITLAWNCSECARMRSGGEGQWRLIRLRISHLQEWYSVSNNISFVHQSGSQLLSYANRVNLWMIVASCRIFFLWQKIEKNAKKKKSQIMPFRGLLKLRFIYKAEGGSNPSFKLADSSDLKTFNRPFHPPYKH